MKFLNIITFVLGFLPAVNVIAQDMAKSYNLLIGTYTSGKSNGIYVYTFNTETGNFSYKSEIGGITNPSFLAVTQDRSNVYAVSETGKGQGSVSAFAFENHQ